MPVGPVQVRGQQSPVFGTDRPGSDPAEAIMDVARIVTGTLYSGPGGDDQIATWSLPAIPVEEDERWFCTATVYNSTISSTAPYIFWSDAGSAATTIWSPPLGFSAGQDVFASDGSGGLVHTYQAVFDYPAGSTATVTFNYLPGIGDSGDVTLTAEISTVRGIAGETTPGTDISQICITDDFEIPDQTCVPSFTSDLTWNEVHTGSGSAGGGRGHIKDGNFCFESTANTNVSALVEIFTHTPLVGGGGASLDVEVAVVFGGNGGTYDRGLSIFKTTAERALIPDGDLKNYAGTQQYSLFARGLTLEASGVHTASTHPSGWQFELRSNATTGTLDTVTTFRAPGFPGSPFIVGVGGVANQPVLRETLEFGGELSFRVTGIGLETFILAQAGGNVVYYFGGTSAWTAYLNSLGEPTKTRFTNALNDINIANGEYTGCGMNILALQKTPTVLNTNEAIEFQDNFSEFRACTLNT